LYVNPRKQENTKQQREMWQNDKFVKHYSHSLSLCGFLILWL
jgi:hypothetical protein